MRDENIGNFMKLMMPAPNPHHWDDTPRTVVWPCANPWCQRKVAEIWDLISCRPVCCMSYPLVNIQKAIEHGPVEIVSFPFKMVDLSVVFCERLPCRVNPINISH